MLTVCKNGEHHEGARFCFKGVLNVYLGRQTREGAEGMHFICLVPRPNPPARKNGLVNQVDFLGLVDARMTV